MIISDQLGSGIDDLWADGGRVSWLENTGDSDHAKWTRRTIGRSPGINCVRAGHFTRDDRWQICAVSIMVKSNDLTTPGPVIIFTAPDDPRTHDGDWSSELVFEAPLVHEVVVIPKGESGLCHDQILLAGRDGIDLLWHNDGKWESYNVGRGLPQSPGNPYWGAGSVAFGRVGSDYAAYIPATEVGFFHISGATFSSVGPM